MKRFILTIIKSINIIICFTYSVAKLLLNINIIRKAQVVVLLPDGGFGHTITGPDITRKVYKGQRCVFIVFSEYSRHNWKVSLIWTDIEVIFLPLSIGTKYRVFGKALVFPWAYWYRERVINIVKNIFNLLNASCNIHYVNEVYGNLQLPKEIGKDELKPGGLNNFGHSWPTGYFKLSEKVFAPNVYLPNSLQRDIENKILNYLPEEKKDKIKLCCLYLRQKGLEEKDDASNYTRSGSNFEDYIMAIKKLNNSGYIVLLTGDVVPSLLKMKEFNGMLIDNRLIKIDKNLFYIYAATNSDIFIGEPGGGAWLPNVNNILKLIINAFPFSYGLPNSWVYYKTVRDRNGNLMKFEKLLSDYSYHYNFEEFGFNLYNNSADEIYRAVSSFIEDINKPVEYNPGADIVSKISNYSWLKISKAKISPEWLRLYSV